MVCHLAHFARHYDLAIEHCRRSFSRPLLCLRSYGPRSLPGADRRICVCAQPLREGTRTPSHKSREPVQFMDWPANETDQAVEGGSNFPSTYVIGS